MNAAHFEDAITATGFGKYNILLLLTLVPPALSQVFETAALSYVFPIAQCDLDLSLEDKGLLNAITFAGMLTSGFLWGYLSDTSGRRRVMVIGYFLCGFAAMIASSSQNSTMLITAKFFGGFMLVLIKHLLKIRLK
ncbi:hypothetical protein NQ314_019133 [Rhamnusium bicolor]|uniref:Major facilitator superfamily (MFS) profile domain-containing protein n=1 Tax=Rhamnusium bicolor TaxID=1586634 RepID=A0AAV8WPD3_9CUCU|nr:hypothetical protein NQ314_019133 [Rhamnusium bicolor]